jgi:hypothetical protein
VLVNGLSASTTEAASIGNVASEAAVDPSLVTNENVKADALVDESTWLGVTVVATVMASESASDARSPAVLKVLITKVAKPSPELSTTVIELYRIDIDPTAAEEGIAETIPKPNAETATSAMRLRVVFVDICFLSIKVGSRAFPESAWHKKALSYDMRRHLLSVKGENSQRVVEGI